MNLEISNRIKKIREFRNYTQAYVAKKLGIRQNTYSKVENGIISIKPKRLEQIARILDVPVNSITDQEMHLLNFVPIHKQKEDIVLLIEKMIVEIQGLKEQNISIIRALKMRIKYLKNARHQKSTR